MKRNLIPALVYLASAFAFVVYFDSLYGAGPVTRGLWLVNLAIVGTALFAAACVLSLFTFRVGLICAVAGALFAWPLFAIAIIKIPWTSLISIFPYSNWLDLLMAIVALVVSTLYSARRAFLLFRGHNDAQRHNMGLTLVAAGYAAGVFVLAYWRGIWDWMFRLRYGG